jgi:hypothetical protein
MDDTLKSDLGKALLYFTARTQAMRSDEYLAAVDTIIALKEECKSNAAFSKVLEEEGFTEEILPRNERSCITGWFADLDADQRKRVIDWMSEREKDGDTFRLQTAERHFAKQFNDEDEQEEDEPKQKPRARRSPPSEEEADAETESISAEQLQKDLKALKEKYTELELKLASATSELSITKAKLKDNKLAAENKMLKARIKELENKIKELTESSVEG